MLVVSLVSLVRMCGDLVMMFMMWRLDVVILSSLGPVLGLSWALVVMMLCCGGSVVVVRLVVMFVVGLVLMLCVVVLLSVTVLTSIV